MPVLKFRNFLAASRRRNMMGFGMYRAEAGADLEVIEDAASGSIAISGTQNGANTIFTLSAAPIPPADLIIAYNGLIQKLGVDYVIAGATLTFTMAPVAEDILLAFITGGES